MPFPFNKLHEKQKQYFQSRKNPKQELQYAMSSSSIQQKAIPGL